MAVDAKDNGVVEFQFYKPDNRTKWETFQKAIYDKSTNQYLGRTPKSWGQLFLFYSIFYIVLAALFAICMQGLFATLDDREPRWKLNDSLIGVNPGLGFRPISNKTEEGSLIWYNITNTTSIDKWVNFVDSFLKEYKQNQTGQNFVPCYFNKLPGKSEVCITTPSDFGNCHANRMYGYNTSSPCVFLKLNRIFDWVPSYFTTPQPGMPTDLTNYIISTANTTERRIWVTCNGVTDFDKENIKGFKYNPPGFASYYYPFKNVKNYLSPIVSVEILDITPNVLIQIECRSWADNIHYRGGTLNRAGSVTFEIQVDREHQPPVTGKSAKLKDVNEEINATINKETEAVTISAIVNTTVVTAAATA